MLYVNRVWGHSVTRPKCHRLKMGKKLTNLKQYISVIIDIDEKWFVIFEYTIDHLFLVMFSYLKLKIIFLVLHFFFVFPMLSTNKLLNTLYLKFVRLKISGLLCDRNRECQFGWFPFNQVLKILNFYIVTA